MWGLPCASGVRGCGAFWVTSRPSLADSFVLQTPQFWQYGFFLQDITPLSRSRLLRLVKSCQPAEITSYRLGVVVSVSSFIYQCYHINLHLHYLHVHSERLRIVIQESRTSSVSRSFLKPWSLLHLPTLNNLDSVLHHVVKRKCSLLVSTEDTVINLVTTQYSIVQLQQGHSVATYHACQVRLSACQT